MPKKKPVGINQVRRAKLNQWMENADTLFRTLVLPIAFLITITSTFMFEYYGRAFPDEEWSALLRALVPISMTHISIFISSIILWSASVLLKKNGKVEINTMKQFKFSTLVFLWISILIIPGPLIVMSASYAFGYEIAIVIYMIFFIIAVAFLTWKSLPPK